MGVVFRARQKSLNRFVALNFPTRGLLAGTQAVERCRQEARALAALRHPNIVSIYEVGVHEDNTYLSMEYFEGGNLATLLKDSPPTQQQAVEYARTIASAIDHAHTRGIVHRDLKPANILVDAGGTIRIADFGLGKILSVENSLTQTGQILGTLRYMAPEQADGSGDQSPMAGDVVLDRRDFVRVAQRPSRLLGELDVGADSPDSCAGTIAARSARSPHP